MYSNLYLIKKDFENVKSMLAALKADKYAREFLNPVDHKGLNLYDYTTVIK